MLSKRQSQKLSNKNSLCDCTLIKPSHYPHEEGNILISHHRQISQLVSLRTSPNKKSKINLNKPKTSLRASRVFRQKQNMGVNVREEEQCKISIINQLANETIIPTHLNDNNTTNTNKHKDNIVKTSIFFKKVEQSITPKSKKETQFFQKYKKQEQNQTQRQNLDVNYKKSIKKLNQSNTELQQLQSKQCRTVDDILSKQLSVFQDKLGSLVMSKKKTKVFNKLQLLQFKSTQSINDSTSVQNSQIISDINSQQHNHSQKNLVKINKLSQLLRTKYSRVTQHNKK